MQDPVPSTVIVKLANGEYHSIPAATVSLNPPLGVLWVRWDDGETIFNLDHVAYWTVESIAPDLGTPPFEPPAWFERKAYLLRGLLSGDDQVSYLNDASFHYLVEVLVATLPGEVKRLHTMTPAEAAGYAPFGASGRATS